MLVTVSGIVTEVTITLPLNALSPIPVTFFPSISSGITTVELMPV